MPGESARKIAKTLLPNTTLQTAKGKHRIRFGDNPEVASLGTVAVDTPFGKVHFHVIPTNTPFLFCLRDMDEHCVYFNNVRDIVNLRRASLGAISPIRSYANYTVDSVTLQLIACTRS
jgi:hypothetical protein